MLKKIIFDKRYKALKTVTEKKGAFEEYLRENEEKERQDKESQHREVVGKFLAFLRDQKDIKSDTRMRDIEDICRDDARYDELNIRFDFAIALLVTCNLLRWNLPLDFSWVLFLGVVFSSDRRAFRDAVEEYQRELESIAMEERRAERALLKAFLGELPGITWNSRWKDVEQLFEDSSKLKSISR